MKNRILATVLLLFPLLGIAQEEFTGQIRWGEPIKLNKKESGPNPIGLAGDDLYMFKTKNAYALNPKKREYFLQTYNPSTLALLHEVKLNKEYKGHALVLVNNFIFDNRLMLISYYVNEESNQKIYLLYENDNGEVKDPVELATVNDSKAGKRMVMMNSYLKMSTFSTIVSEDKKTLMVLYTDEITNENEDPDRHTVVINNELQEVSRGVLDLDDYLVSGMRLLNDGRLLILGFEAVTGETKGIIKRETIEAGESCILFYNGSTLDKTPIDIARDVQSMSSKVKPNGEIIVYGLYSNEKAKGVSGAFFLQLNADAEVQQVSTQDFEEDFITQYWTEKEKKKAEKRQEKGKEDSEPAFYNYVIHDLIIKENGDMTLLAEQYHFYVTTHTTYSNGKATTYTVYHYVYNDIIAVNCTQDGDINWMQAMKKRQHTTNDGGYFSSFFTSVQGNNMYLIYNNSEAGMDSEAYAEMSARDKKKARRNTLTAMFSIGEDGSVAHNKLFDFEEEAGRRLVPRACEKMSANEILLFTNSVKDRTPVLGWLTL